MNPCHTTTCGINAECRVNNHRALCICKPGYEGDPYEICEERKSDKCECCLSKINLQKVTLMYLSAGCKSDDECPLHLACYNRECQDPCIYEQCGQNAQCSVRNHKAKCDCLPGYRGNPYQNGKPGCRQYECLTDPECPDHLACRNEKCVDPCDCAEFAQCTARNHRGICVCNAGYTGDPYGIRCTPSKFEKQVLELIGKNVALQMYCFAVPKAPEPECRVDADCPSKHACIHGRGDPTCLNPCLEFRPCANNAHCEVKDELPLRVMTCTCDAGFTGKGDEYCERILEPEPVGCDGDYECASQEACNPDRQCRNPCQFDNPCAENAICTASNHRARCECPPGFQGNARSYCERSKYQLTLESLM